MRLIDADKLQQFPIRANRCDEEHANTHYYYQMWCVFRGANIYAKDLPSRKGR